MTFFCAALCFTAGYLFCWALEAHPPWFRISLFVVSILATFIAAFILGAGS